MTNMRTLPGTKILLADPPPLEKNPLQKALDDYHRMEQELQREKMRNTDLRNENRDLLSEVGMLREAAERSDCDRIRLQAISSTLLGRLYGISDVIEGAVRAAIRDGVKAATVHEETKDTPKAPEPPAEPVEKPVVDLTPKSPVHNIGSPTVPAVDWSTLPRSTAD